MGYGTILIVDDDTDLLRLLDMELSSEGYYVLKAMSGQEAIKKAQDFLPDLIVMDVVMPDMNGGQVIKWLKSMGKTKNIPVIFLTAMLSKEEEKVGRDGVNIDELFYPTIAKPFNTQELLDEINRAIHHHLQL